MNHIDRILKHAKWAKAKFLVVCAGSLALAAALIISSPKTGTSEAPLLPNNRPFENPSGLHATFSTSGSIDLRNEFFQNLGTNGRNCGTCHRAEEGWTITPAGVQARFTRTKGTDPIFRTNDGSNSPNADVSTVKARRAAYSMLLTKGLIRVGIGIPNDAEFELIAVDDPYEFASAAELSLSVGRFLRPT
jgi:cytochrome c peroxidase